MPGCRHSILKRLAISFNVSICQSRGLFRNLFNSFSIFVITHDTTRDIKCQIDIPQLSRVVYNPIILIRCPWRVASCNGPGHRVKKILSDIDRNDFINRLASLTQDGALEI